MPSRHGSPEGPASPRSPPPPPQTPAPRRNEEGRRSRQRRTRRPPPPPPPPRRLRHPPWRPPPGRAYSSASRRSETRRRDGRCDPCSVAPRTRGACLRAWCGRWSCRKAAGTRTRTRARACGELHAPRPHRACPAGAASPGDCCMSCPARSRPPPLSPRRVPLAPCVHRIPACPRQVDACEDAELLRPAGGEAAAWSRQVRALWY